MNRFLLLFLFFIAPLQAAERPNILLIMADDLGFSDLACYGSSLNTPHLDKLASQGTRFANFRVNAMCVVTRTSLLTGHEHSQSANYSRSLPLSKALLDAGYQTSISGKWHQPSHPMDHGFQEFYGFLGGAINNFTGSGNIMRQRTPEAVPADWFATDAFTTHAIASIEKSLADKKPFFTYLAFNAPHTPLNVPKNLVDKYNGKFDEGWSVLRKKRIAKLHQLGLIDDRYRDTHQTHVSDLYPTFLELAGTSYIPKGKKVPLMGRSILPLLKNPNLPQKETQHPVVWAYNDTSRGYLNYPWKINSVNEGPWQLYNLDNDPCEITNLAKKHQIKIESLANAWQTFAEKETNMPTAWHRPLSKVQHGWGFHRLTMTSPFITSTPLCSQANVPLKTNLSFTFTKPLDFKNTPRRPLQLFRVQDPTTAIWTADPDESHPAQGQKTVSFAKLPKLQPNTSYYLLV